MKNDEWPDELNFMHLRRLDLQDGGTRSQEFLRRYAVRVDVDAEGKVVGAPAAEMRAKLLELKADAEKILKIN